ncbi:MAG: hypothetical protein HY592_01215 [Candidatus Omnitrophica bacterium]|nr:hypothetical protein [Candidatus Omnitrophota bacterium]
MKLFDDIRVDDSHESVYRITEDVYRQYVEFFKDQNPIHIDDQFARKAGFEGRVMHGGILNGFISHFVGMVFPAGRSLLQSVHIEFKNPNYLNDEIILKARVAQIVPSVKVVVVKMDLFNKTRSHLSASAKTQIGMMS